MERPQSIRPLVQEVYPNPLHPHVLNSRIVKRSIGSCTRDEGLSKIKRLIDELDHPSLPTCRRNIEMSSSFEHEETPGSLLEADQE